jgi:hypothetical protein
MLRSIETGEVKNIVFEDKEERYYNSEGNPIALEKITNYYDRTQISDL